MKNWKKNAVVASILVFVCAGIYLNWMYTQDQETANLTDTLNEEKILGNSTLVMSQTGSLAADAAKEDLQAASGQTTDYFAAVRLSRQQSRDSAVSTLQEAMSYGEDAQASSASKELEGLVETALCEAQIESLVIAKGYTDCVAYMNDGGISVAVAAPEEGLQETDVALISDIVMTQADLDRVVQQTIARERRRAEAALEAARAEAGRAERERLEAGMAQRERDVARRELAAHAREALAARGLPGELAGVLDYSGQEALDASLDSAERAFRAAVQRGMEQRLRGEPPRTGTSDPGAAFLARVRAAAGLEK